MTEKVAVIAVHGVADQKAGETARALVNLLVSTRWPDGAEYTAQAEQAVTLAVPPLKPWSDRPPTSASPTPAAEDRSFSKALVQSWRSDLMRIEPVDAKKNIEPADANTKGGPAPSPAADEVRDAGLELTNYLLAKHIENGAGNDAYDTKAIALERRLGNDTRGVDVYEMYWADLSRLSGSVPRIVTEAFTLIFRLSRLGRDTVDLAYRSLRADRWGDSGAGLLWRGTAWLQRALDWVFVNVLAMVMLQLALCGALLVVFGLAHMLGCTHLATLVVAVPIALAVLGALLFRYRAVAPSTGATNLLLPVALIAVAAFGLWPAVRPWVSLAVMTVMSLAINSGLKVAGERFPFAHVSGSVAWGITLLLMLLGWMRSASGEWTGGSQWLLAEAQCARDAVTGPYHVLVEVWMRGALYATEGWLLATKYSLVVVTFAALLWLFGGLLASLQRGYQVRASLATGRLGLVVSVGAFLAAVMGLWAILGWVMNYAVCGTTACGLHEDHSIAYVPAVFANLPDGTRINHSWTYLQDRFTQSTKSFGLVAGVLTLLIVYLVVMMLPSVLAELKFLVDKRRLASKQRCREMKRDDTTQYASKSDADQAAAKVAAKDASNRLRHAKQLGKWLTSGYRWLDTWTLLVALAGSLAVTWTYLGLRLNPAVADTSFPLLQSLWEGLLIGAGSLAASLIAFGGLLSKYAPTLRGPLDVALDVDNHFREFPRTEIPRARIFSRYAALLRHVDAQGYDHIVVVAHSQGTVISAELLRFLKSKTILQALKRVRLLTLGCPLRQLYAARFPTLYSWVLKPQSDGDKKPSRCGPRAEDIGVERWFNAFCAGDYVGRWLWSNKVERERELLSNPCDDATEGLGRTEAYSPFDPTPPMLNDFITLREAETCLGLGAHTHYFEPEQETVAWLIDYLVTAGVDDEPVDAAAPEVASRAALATGS
jgi:hypothetical protein